MTEPRANHAARAPVLEIRGLRVHFVGETGALRALDGVDLVIGDGEIVGLVGESGSGKSVTAYSILGLIERPGRIVDGSIRLLGRELVGAGESVLRAVRGKEVAMVFQDPMMTLNPVLRVDTQMTEAITAHARVDAAHARKRARDALARVGIAAPEERLRAYPHQLSGGMRQRVAIAIALLNRPRLLVADEPTTALDVTIQAQILYEMQRLCRESGTALLWISHDLAVVSGLADRIAVMYGGRLVETGPSATIVRRPAHPYTRGLIESIPTRESHGRRLTPIPGSPPSLREPSSGCAFAPRCAYASEACRRPPPWFGDMLAGVRCWHPLSTEAPR